MSRKHNRKQNSQSRRTVFSERPVFYIGRENPCLAGGVIFYRYTQDDVEFLMINMNGRYEDFGGKTDPRDASIRETIAREVFEESNGIFSRGFILPQIKGHGMYMRGGKYLLYFIELKENIDVKRFGTVETTEQIVRTVEWVISKTLLSKETNLHARLRRPQFFVHVKQLVDKIGFVPLTSTSSAVSDDDINVISEMVSNLKLRVNTVDDNITVTPNIWEHQRKIRHAESSSEDLPPAVL